MIKYEYGRIAVLAQSLENAGVAQEIIDQIMAGGDTIKKTTTPEKKADWMRETMQRMNKLLDKDTILKTAKYRGKNLEVILLLLCSYS